MSDPKYRTTLDRGDSIEVRLVDGEVVRVDWYDTRGDHEYRQEWRSVDAVCDELADRTDDEAGAIRRTIADILVARGVCVEDALYRVRHRKPVAPPEPTHPAALWAYRRRAKGPETDAKRARGVGGFLARAIADVVVCPTAHDVPTDLADEYTYWRDLAAHLGRQDTAREADLERQRAAAPPPRDDRWAPKDEWRGDE